MSFRDNSCWTYDNAAMESSSFMSTGPVMAWFTANIGYHHVHHLNSRVPFYRLPEVVAAIPELQAPKITTLRPAEIFRCLRLKVWDAEAKKMVGTPRLSRTVPPPAVQVDRSFKIRHSKLEPGSSSRRTMSET